MPTNRKNMEPPSERPKKKPSKAQLENRERFRQATQYAKEMMLQHGYKNYYRCIAIELKLPNAYVAAVTDFLRRPKTQTVVAKRAKASVRPRKPRVRKEQFTEPQVTLAVGTKKNMLIQQLKPNRTVDGWLVYKASIYLDEW